MLMCDVTGFAGTAPCSTGACVGSVLEPGLIGGTPGTPSGFRCHLSKLLFLLEPCVLVFAQALGLNCVVIHASHA